MAPQSEQTKTRSGLSGPLSNQSAGSSRWQLASTALLCGDRHQQSPHCGYRAQPVLSELGLSSAVLFRHPQPLGSVSASGKYNICEGVSEKLRSAWSLVYRELYRKQALAEEMGNRKKATYQFKVGQDILINQD